MDTFSKNLRARARHLSLSDAEVARRAGLSERRYGHYVTGRGEPDLETLVRICTVLGTTPNDLLGFETQDAEADESPEIKERKTLSERIGAACNVLQIDNLRLTVRQLEALVLHQREL